MKRLIIISVMAILSMSTMMAHPSKESDNQKVDSLLNVLSSMPLDTNRFNKALEMYYEYSGFSFAESFLIASMNDADALNDDFKRLLTFYAYISYYDDQNDIGKMQETFDTIKRLSYKLKQYRMYFRAWNMMLNRHLEAGQYEKVALEGQMMKEEAEKLHYDRGKVTANITLCGMYRRINRLDMAAELYKEIIAIPDVAMSDKLTSMLNLANIYQSEHNFKECLHYLARGKNYLNSFVSSKGIPRMRQRANFLTIELLYCGAYLTMEDAVRLKQHIDSSRVYMPDILPDKEYILYHSHLARYHNLIGNDDEAFRELDLTMARAKDYSIFQYLNFYNWKAAFYLNKKDTLSSLHTLDQLTMKEDSLHTRLMEIQKESIEENFRMEKAVLHSESLRVILGYMFSCSILLIVLAVIVFNIKSLVLYIQSKKNYKQSQESYALADKANKMKEIFVKNVSFEIRSYLSEVVGFSELISETDSHSPEEMVSFANAISTNAGKLTTLITNVLDLSRLEAGMMKFQIEKKDILDLCRGCNIAFDTDLLHMYRKVDSVRFVKVIKTTMSEESKVSIMCYGKKAKITITETALVTRSDRSADVTDDDIYVNINTYTIRSFHGLYSIDRETKTATIIL